MNTEMTGTVAKILNDMAAALGTTAENLWPILVRQSYIEGVRGMLLVVLAASALVWLCRWAPRQPKDGLDEPTFPTVLVCAVVGILGVICAIGGFIDAWHIANPEYYAAAKILDAIGGAR